MNMAALSSLPRSARQLFSKEDTEIIWKPNVKTTYDFAIPPGVIQGLSSSNPPHVDRIFWNRKSFPMAGDHFQLSYLSSTIQVETSRNFSFALNNFLFFLRWSHSTNFDFSHIYDILQVDHFFVILAHDIEQPALVLLFQANMFIFPCWVPSTFQYIL